MTNENGRKLAIWGACLHLFLFFGLLGTVFGMVKAFEKQAASENVPPEALSHDISIALITTAIGILPGLIGLVLMGIALFDAKYRAPWFFVVLSLYACFWMLNFPVGTVAGVALIVYLILKRIEFFNTQIQPGSESEKEVRPS